MFDINKWYLLFYIALIIIIIWFSMRLINNTEPQHTNAIEELTKAIVEKSDAINKCTNVLVNSKSETDGVFRNVNILECYTQNIKDYEADLKAIALSSCQDAKEDYHKSLSILISLFAFLGIALPLLVSLVNYHIFDKDFNTIEKEFSDMKLKYVNEVDELKEEINNELKKLSETNKNFMRKFEGLNSDIHKTGAEMPQIAVFCLSTVFGIYLAFEYNDVTQLLCTLYIVLYKNKRIYALCELINTNTTESDEEKQKKSRRIIDIDKEAKYVIDKINGIIDSDYDLKEKNNGNKNDIKDYIERLKNVIEEIKQDNDEWSKKNTEWLQHNCVSIIEELQDKNNNLYKKIETLVSEEDSQKLDM